MLKEALAQIEHRIRLINVESYTHEKENKVRKAKRDLLLRELAAINVEAGIIESDISRKLFNRKNGRFFNSTCALIEECKVLKNENELNNNINSPDELKVKHAIQDLSTSLADKKIAHIAKVTENDKINLAEISLDIKKIKGEFIKKQEQVKPSIIVRLVHGVSSFFAYLFRRKGFFHDKCHEYYRYQYLIALSDKAIKTREHYLFSLYAKRFEIEHALDKNMEGISVSRRIINKNDKTLCEIYKEKDTLLKNEKGKDEVALPVVKREETNVIRRIRSEEVPRNRK